MRTLLIAISLGVCLARGLHAQSITATLTGTVTDSSGALVPNAEVTITNTETGVRTAVTTDRRGGYTAALLPRGQYNLEVSAPGFRKFVQEGITLQVQQTARVDVELALGPVAEAVVVTADAVRLETENATLAKIVDNRTIVNLPLNTRNVYSLVFLTPGVTGTVGNSYGEMRYSVNGGRQRTMDTLIDGVTAAHPTVNGFAGISVFPSVDAIEEFKLMGANFPAEFGRSLGSVLNIVFKSGTNTFHGRAYEFLRNSVLDANNFFDNFRGRKLASFKRSQFGGVFDGPVVRNRTFFMVSYEGLRERSAANTVFSVPTELERRGDFSQTRAANGQVITIYDPLTTRPNPNGPGFIRAAFTGNVIPADRMDPVALNVLKYYPLPNTKPSGVTNQNNYSNSASRPLDMN
ncbi:MAG TPA: TonB-dependent receptor, partial [Bryobacteraceae bacterium]|nr:TonB-dependent receptor [Bryobacteraceae bacterium]